ncbi:hypothetical protein THAOC_27190, partial [Thalassiosira oceanica]
RGVRQELPVPLRAPRGRRPGQRGAKRRRGDGPPVDGGAGGDHGRRHARRGREVEERRPGAPDGRPGLTRDGRPGPGRGNAGGRGSRPGLLRQMSKSIRNFAGLDDLDLDTEDEEYGGGGGGRGGTNPRMPSKKGAGGGQRRDRRQLRRGPASPPRCSPGGAARETRAVAAAGPDCSGR